MSLRDDKQQNAGAVVILHSRGEGRSSMWINQELAVLAYRQFFESLEIPILVFKEDSVKLEGAMSAFIANAKPLGDEETVVEEVRRWLADKAAKGRPDEHAAFAQIAPGFRTTVIGPWQTLSDLLQCSIESGTAPCAK